eukprot:s519_g14.t1
MAIMGRGTVPTILTKDPLWAKVKLMLPPLQQRPALQALLLLHNNQPRNPAQLWTRRRPQLLALAAGLKPPGLLTLSLALLPARAAIQSIVLAIIARNVACGAEAMIARGMAGTSVVSGLVPTQLNMKVKDSFQHPNSGKSDGQRTDSDRSGEPATMPQPVAPPTLFQATPLGTPVGPSHVPKSFRAASSSCAGIAGKVPLTRNLPDGIYAISESHLTVRGRARFDLELRQNKSKFGFLSGAPAPYKKAGMKAVGGKHTGVGFLTNFPHRNITSGWNPELYSTGRLCCATFQVGSHFIAGAVVYGYASHADTKEVQMQTNQLLCEVSNQIVHTYPGPAFVAGDFNQSPGILAEQIEWERLGWCDVQTWAERNFGIAPGHTCRYRTRKDYIMLSPALQQLMLRSHNEYDRFPDHSSLMAILQLPSQPSPIARWRSPKPINYNQVAVQVIHQTPCEVPDVDLDHPTKAVQQLCSQFESHVNDVQIAHGAVGLTPMQKGFGKSFSDWWDQNAPQHPSWFPWCPSEPPASDVAQHFADVIGSMYKELEQSLRAKSVEQARKRRMDDPNKIFHDLRKAPPVPVQMLLATKLMKVQDIPDSGSVVVDQTADLDLSKPCETQQGPLQILHAEEDQIWFTSEHQLAVGDSITQTSLQGDIPTLHEAFLQAWQQRWDAHRHVSDEHWTEIIEFIQLSMPTAPMQLRPLTVDRWYQALKSKKARSAKGMDSVSRADLLAMPLSFHAQVVRILNNLESEGTWPDQWLDGAVHSLAKVDTPEVISHFRPITVMPLIYRTYTSLRARELLRHISQVAPASMYGNRPGQTAMSLWWSLQQRIELSLYQEASSNGVISDIIKAFNCLPRLPVFAAARAIGVPKALLHAWGLATTKLRRYFYIQGSPSAPAYSCTGFVEGCGLSVRAMSLLNLVIHRFMALRHPTIVFMSYVDNYELEAWSVHAAQEGLKSLDKFCKLLDISLDHAKTCQWATAPGDRKILRNLDIQPVRSCRDLGGQMSYTSCRNNSIVTSKLAKLEDTWHKLGRSNAPLMRKFQILRIVTWPRALHAASTVHLGPSHFDHARAQAMQALGLSKMGSNPQIQLALICHPLSDPEFYATWDSLSQARRHGEPTIFNVLLAYAAQMELTKVKPGPAGVLYLRLFQLGWSYAGESVFHDEGSNPIHLWDTPMPELKCRVTRSYARYVGKVWAHRKDFNGLQAVHPGLSSIDRTKFSLDEVGMLRSLQNGTMFTNDCLVHIEGPEGSSTDRCRFCGCLDSLEHRHWSCEATQFSRDLIPQHLLDAIQQSPDCTRNRGWMVEPDSFSAFKDALYAIPALVSVSPVVFHGRHLDLFTDGSGLDPAIPVARLVGWGVAIGGETIQHAATPHAWGGLHGEWQTVPRAETMAVLVALTTGQRWHGPFSVWSDNELVVNRARALQAGTLTITRSMADHDLWQSIQHVLLEVPDCKLHLVRSHQNQVGVEEWEAWVFRMNDSADMLAQFAVDSLSADIHKKQQATVAAWKHSKDMCSALHQHFVRVATLSVSSQPTSTSVPVEPCNDTVGLVHWGAVLRACNDLPPNLKFAGIDKVFSWMTWFEDPQQPVVALSWYETLWAYQMHSQTWGVQSTSCHNTWKERTAITAWLQEQCGDQQITTVKASLAHMPPAASSVPKTHEGRSFGLHRFFG